MPSKSLSIIEVKKQVYALETACASVGLAKEKFIIEANFAMQAIEKNPKLLNCPPKSIETAVYNVALTGTSLNPSLQLAFLIPRAGRCVLDISARGLCQIAMSSGSIKKIWGNCIHENDTWDIEEGSDPYVKHKISYGENRGKFICTYCIYMLPDGEQVITVSDVEKVEKARLKSQIPNGDAWKIFYDSMAYKTVIKVAAKWMPQKNDKLAQAINILNEHEGLASTNGNHRQKPNVQIPQAISEEQPDVQIPQAISKEQPDSKKIIEKKINIRKMILQMNDNDMEEAKKTFEKLTKRKNLKELSNKEILELYPKINGMYTEWVDITFPPTNKTEEEPEEEIIIDPKMNNLKLLDDNNEEIFTDSIETNE